jgi:mRNA-degrading endonuclease toxin of MazEF toxin-antitoxin module
MNRGEVILADWQFSDRTGSKLRPAVVVQAEFLNTLLDDTILVQITGTKHGIPGTEVEIDPAKETISGLKCVCYASCINLLTVDPDFIDQVIGVLSDASLRKIEACLKTVLEMP